MLSPITALARRCRGLNRPSANSGQSLIETALAIPFLLLIALNAINFAYYFFVAINLAAAPRNAVEYSVQGFATPSQLQIPKPGPACSNPTRGTPDLAVSSLAYYDIIAVLPNTGIGGNPPCPNIASVQVCNSQAGGLNNKGLATQTTSCISYGPAPANGFGTALAADPEAPNFLLDRVDVVYTVAPLIGGTLPVYKGMSLNLLPTFHFHRQVSMREMN